MALNLVCARVYFFVAKSDIWWSRTRREKTKPFRLICTDSRSRVLRS